ncbi:MAG TPA: metalloregulator ArsR/SmtB family transcription factor [Rudaea sp.]|nr:metalloregulator ArsR/SmtB family transcription factor [Rudaea sp.]
MKSSEAIAALKALAHARRLEIFRLLVQAGDGGLTVGALQMQTRLAPATLTNHLNVLRHAGLVNDRREGRNIWCRADYTRMNALLAHLTENCCAGEPCGIDSACAPTPNKPRRRTRK